MSVFGDIIGGDADSWLNSVPQPSLATIRELLNSGKNLEQVAELWLSQGGTSNTVPFGGAKPSANLWQKVKSECHKLLCGDSDYKALRLKIEKSWNGSKTTLIATIAASLSPIVGVAAAVLIPVLGMLLSIIVKIGLNSWCSTES